MSGFLKRTEAEQADQLDNMAAKVDGYTATLDITPTEVANTKADALYFRWVLTVVNIYDAYKQSITEHKNLIKKNPGNLPAAAFPPMPAIPAAPPVVQGGVLDRFTKLGKKLKLHNNYTISIGEDLQLIAPEDAVDVDNAKPVLALGADPEGTRISFNLHGYFDGVNIYRMRAPDDATFAFLVRDVSSPYIDPDGTAAGTRYKAFYVIGDHEVGLVSDEAVVGA